MDKIGQAQEADANFLHQALKIQSDKTSTGTSRSCCVDCGAKIPELRRQIVQGCSRCVDCETMIETENQKRR